MLENPVVNIKVKLAALWTSVLFCYIYGDYFELFVPGQVDNLLTGDNILDSPVKLLIASVVVAIPSLMISASIFLGPKVNRILNMLFGVLFTMIMVFIGINSITEWYSFYVFLAILESILTCLIVWYAWRWPNVKNV